MDQPTEFGPYLLLERISLGGMAEVFKAVEFGVEGFERTVAVKRILPHVAEDEEFIAMFKDEAHIAVQLTHSNIAQIYNLGHENDSFYIALEYVAGRDLRTIFEHTRKSAPMPIAQACYCVMQVCEGLDYAHNKKDKYGRSLNIIHRDVSPPNVLVSYEGEVKLIDFGVAKAAGRASQTQAGILKGKFGYMSPEQVKGMALDRRSDVFALGVVLWELLTAHRLFQGETDFATLEKVRAVEVDPPSQFNPEIPPELEKIVFKVLAADPDERYQSATELHDDLQAFMFAKGLFYSRKDLAAWMRGVYAREIELEKEKANERAAQVAASRGSRSTGAGGPPPPPGRGGPPKPPGKPGGRKRAKTMVMATAKPDIPGQKGGPPRPPGRAVTGTSAKKAPPPRPKPKAPAPKAPAPRPKAPAPAAAGGAGDFDWDDDELETRLFGDEGDEATSTAVSPPSPAPAAAPRPAPAAPARPAPAAAPAAVAPVAAPAASMSPSAASPAASMPGATPSASMPGTVPPPAVAAPYAPVPPRKNNTVAIVAVVAAVLVVGVLGALFFMRSNGSADDTREAAVADGAQAPAPAVGAISLTLTPADAQVSVDGNVVAGSGSPRVISELTPGTHKVSVSKDGFVPYAQEVSVMAGGSQAVPVSLQVANVTLDVKVDPADAKLELVAGEEKTEIKAKHALERKPGVDYAIHASKKGYKDTTVPIAFTGEAAQSVSVSLVSDGSDEPKVASSGGARKKKKRAHTPSKPKNSELVIGVKPGLPPADIYVDNKKVGRGVVKYKVSAGGHTVKWKWANGKSDSQKVSISANETKKLRGSF